VNPQVMLKSFIVNTLSERTLILFPTRLESNRGRATVSGLCNVFTAIGVSFERKKQVGLEATWY